jgi:putative flippase GtrA
VKLAGQVARYGVVGALNTAIGLAVIYGGMALGLGDIAANAIGYLVGLSLSYALNSHWTFRYRGSHAGAAPRFLLVIAVAYAVNLGTLLLARDWAGLSSRLAQLCGVIAYVGVGFAGSRLYAFSR